VKGRTWVTPLLRSGVRGSSWGSALKFTLAPPSMPLRPPMALMLAMLLIAVFMS